MVQLVAFAGVFGLGMSFSLLGSISIKLMPRLNIDKAKFGSLVSALMVSCLVAVLIVGVLLDSVGYKPVAIFGFLLTALCFFLLARANSYGTTLAACLLLGFGAMALNTVGNVLGVKVLFEGEDMPRASNLLNVFFGLGLFITPFLISFLFQKMSYGKAVSVLAAIVLVPVFFAIIASFPESKEGYTLGAAFSLLAEPAALVAAFVLLCYISLEASFCNWLPPFGKEMITSAKPQAEAGAVDASAQRMLSVFAVAMMVSRFTASQIPFVGKHGDYVIAGAAVVAGLVILGMVVAKSIGLAWILAAAAGVSFGPCFPTTVGVTFSKFSDKVHGSLFGIIFAVGLAGAVIVPKAIGNLAKGSTVQKSLKLLLPACVLLIVLALVLGAVGGPTEGPAAIPAAKPAVATQPAEPAIKPVPPPARPAEPAIKPVPPAAKPVPPAAKPVPPATKPAEPAIKPVPPPTRPAEPATKSVPQHTKDALSKVRTLAVLPFHDEKDAKGSGKMLVGAVATELVACPDLKLVERSQLNKVIQEEDLKDMLSASVAVKIGKKVGADTVIVGEVTQYAAQQESAHISAPYSGGGTSTNHRVGLSIRAVNVADGRVIYARSGSGAKKSGFHDAATDAAKKAMKPWRQFFEDRYTKKHTPPSPPAKLGKK